MIAIEGIDHIVLRTSKLEAMCHFYCDVLGCQIERELEPEMGLTQLRAGSALIDLVSMDGKLGKLGGEPPRQEGRNMDHFCLQYVGLEETELLQHLNKHGIASSEYATRYGAQGFGRSIYIQDPEGNVVELKPFQPLFKSH